MATQPTSQTRATEFIALLATQATAIRSMKYGWPPNDTEREEMDARASRLLDLAELLPGTPGDVPPGAYVNDRIASWMRANPLPLTMQRVLDLITPPALYTLEGGVSVVVGDLAKGGYMYRVMADNFAWSGARVEGKCAHDLPDGNSAHPDEYCPDEVVRGDMVLRVPDSVAEHFRQQGRRALQSEMRGLLNVARA